MEEEKVEKDPAENDKIKHIGLVIENSGFGELKMFEQEVTYRDPFLLEISETTESVSFFDRLEEDGEVKQVNVGPTIFIGRLLVGEKGKRALMTLSGDVIKLADAALTLDPTNFKITKWTLAETETDENKTQENKTE
jgi:hypothetical protein